MKLKFSASAPLERYRTEASRVETWLGGVAALVAREWLPNERLDKFNNHYYWAAWALTATAVATNRREFFDKAQEIYRVFTTQVDAEGYLPNELARASRAATYHNYSMLPLAMIAAFAKANGVASDEALTRLALRAQAALEDPASFQVKTGIAQAPLDTDSKSNWAWLEPYCWTVQCSPALLAHRSALQPLGTTRLGGNLSAVFSAAAGIPKPPVLRDPEKHGVTGGLDALNGLCRSTIDKQDFDEAQRICKRITFDAQAMAPGSSTHIASLLNMGDIKARVENYVDADAYYSNALQLVENAGAPASDQAAGILTSLIEFKIKRGKYLDAATIAQRLLSIREATAGASDVNVAIVRARYADLLSQSHQFPEAEAVYGRALAVLEHSGAEHAQTYALTVQHLGEMYERRAQYRQAEQQYRRVVDIAERNGLGYRLLAGALDRAAYVCEQQDKNAEAAAFYRRALQTLRGTTTPPEIMARIQARLAAL